MIHRILILLLVFAAVPVKAGEFREQLAQAGEQQVQDFVVYDPSYFSIKYPGGDVPKDKGVCTDVIIRAYRKLGIDLQQLVHEDMQSNFSKYPKIWGLMRPDTNIDHRRVPNLQTFFKRHGASLPVSQKPSDYQPGDLITWDLRFDSGQVLPHIGMVVNRRSADGGRYLVVHNIGRGPEVEDIIKDLRISGGVARKTGHYFYQPGAKR